MAGTAIALFYNSVNGDRVYDANSFEHMLKKFFTSGVFTGDCQVTADGEGMTCSMAGGYANCDGKVALFSGASALALENASANYDRIDTVVIERNDVDRTITCRIVKGAYSQTPVPTAPVRNGSVFQLVVAEIYVAAGITSVDQTMITDKRPDTSVCGYVLSAVQTPDFSELYAQFTAQAADVIQSSETEIAEWKESFETDAETWKDEFESDSEEWKSDFEQNSETWKSEFEQTARNWYLVRKEDFDDWFANIQTQLDGDVAGHLQNQINEINVGFYIDEQGYVCQRIRGDE